MYLGKKLEAFAERKCEYAQLCINTMHGLRGLHGSIMSEQNHSRTLCHLNDGCTQIQKYDEQPTT